MITVKINIEGYVAEWARTKYYDDKVGAVRFPAGSDVYVLIYDLLQKRPADCPVDRGNLEFALPDRREGKSPETYNHLSQRAVSMIEDKLSLMLWAELHDFMDRGKHLLGQRLKDSALIFLNRYSIESISEDGILKNYQRWRDRQRRTAKRAYRRRS